MRRQVAKQGLSADRWKAGSAQAEPLRHKLSAPPGVVAQRTIKICIRTIAQDSRENFTPAGTFCEIRPMGGIRAVPRSDTLHAKLCDGVLEPDLGADRAVVMRRAL